MGTNCCEQSDLDEITSYELSNVNLAVVTILDEQEHTEAMKGWTKS